MFLNKIRNIFLSGTQNLCPQQMLRARANGETFVSATMCPRLPGPLRLPAKTQKQAPAHVARNYNFECDWLI